jgi:hypothetical protein
MSMNSGSDATDEGGAVTATAGADEAATGDADASQRVAAMAMASQDMEHPR